MFTQYTLTWVEKFQNLTNMKLTWDCKTSEETESTHESNTHIANVNEQGFITLGLANITEEPCRTLCTFVLHAQYRHVHTTFVLQGSSGYSIQQQRYFALAIGHSTPGIH